MIASQPGVDLCNEPLNLWRYRPHFLRLPHPPRGRLISLNAAEGKRLRSYCEDLLSGRIKAFNTWNPFHSTWSFRVNRLVVKLLSANTLIDWFSGEFDIELVYLLRHPVPVALSCLKLNWGNDAGAYLDNPYFREHILGSEKARFAGQVLAKGSPLQKYVVEWCFENLYPLQVYKERSWLVVTYEEIVSRPYPMSELLCSRLGLPDPKRMANTVFRPSRTTLRSESKQAISREGPGALVGKWLERVAPGELQAVQAILDALGIGVYSAQTPYPDAKLCHFGPLETVN